MEFLIQKYRNVLRKQPRKFKRSLAKHINWEARAICIEGARGTGKSTLMLQHIQQELPLDKTLYVSLDDLYFQENRFSTVADQFYKQGGRYLLADEVHKYPGWQRELKNIYDFYPDLQLVVSGSSILALQASQVDLSRRLIRYSLAELSFREFIALKTGKELPSYNLEQLLNASNEVSEGVLEAIPVPLKLFGQYLAYGSYPFFVEGTTDFPIRVNQLINIIIDYDLPESINMETSTQVKLKKLLYIISNAVPFKPNIAKLATQIGTSRTRLLEMLHLLEKAQLIYNLRSAVHGISLMNKPDKVFLRNPGLISTLAGDHPNKGNLRETFFLSQLTNAGYTVTYSKHGDFKVDDKYIFEVGGRNKTNKQIKDIQNSYIAADDIEYGTGNKIPLWLFGFLY